MTRWGMVSLRRAATVAHALPGVRLRLRNGTSTLLEVGHSSQPSPGVIPPCAFRHAVARAHEHLKSGCAIRFLGLPSGDDPAVDVGVRHGDRAHFDGLYRVNVGDMDVHAFATTLSPRRCRELLIERDASVCRHPSAAGSVRLHHDAATEITLVHALTAHYEHPVERHLLLEDLLVGCMAEEIPIAVHS